MTKYLAHVFVEGLVPQVEFSYGLVRFCLVQGICSASLAVAFAFFCFCIASLLQHFPVAFIFCVLVLHHLCVCSGLALSATAHFAVLVSTRQRHQTTETAGTTPLLLNLTGFIRFHSGIQAVGLQLYMFNSITLAL